MLLSCICYRTFCGFEKGIGDICGVKGWFYGWFWVFNIFYNKMFMLLEYLSFTIMKKILLCNIKCLKIWNLIYVFFFVFVV